MGYPCAKFSDFGLSRFGFIVRTHAHRLSEADDRYTGATTVGVSNYSLSEIIIPRHFRQPRLDPLTINPSALTLMMIVHTQAMRIDLIRLSIITAFSIYRRRLCRILKQHVYRTRIRDVNHLVEEWQMFDLRSKTGPSSNGVHNAVMRSRTRRTL